MAKAKKVISTVLAALMVVFTVAGYVPAKAAVVPQIKIVEQPKAEYKVGERMYTKVQCANFSGKVEYRATLWDGSEKKTIEVWKTYPYYYKNWQPTGKTVFPITWIVEKPGVYNLSVYVRPVGSKAPYSTYVKSANFTVKSADVTVDSIAPVADVTVNEGEKVTLPENVTLNMSDKTTKEAKVTWAAVDTTKVGEATVEGTVEGTDKKATVKVVVKAVDLKVESVSAINRKEITVKFTKAVDENSAIDVSNYSTTAGTIAANGIELSEDAKSVTILLADGVVMGNQKEYKLSVSKVKAAAGTQVASVSGQKFTVLDNTLPQVVEAKAIGNKVIKLYVSEPIQEATQSMFKIDGKSFFGSVNLDNKEIVLKPYNPATVLSAGEHTITVAKIKDYSEFVSLQQDIKITVVEDKVAPKVTEVKATLEQAIITFDEDIDPATVAKTDFFWKSGTIKKYATAANVSGNKVILDFTDNPLPAYASTLYVSSIADYCGNALSDAEIAISATVDQTRPEVVDVKVADDYKSVTVKFNKNVTGADKSKYEIKDEDGHKVTIKNVTGSGKEYVIALYDVLPEGVNTLTVSGIADTTTLKNVMLPFTTTLDEIGDETAPKMVGQSGSGRQIMVTFNEVMDLASLSDTGNYLINFAGSFRKLPDGTEMTPVQDGKAILIVLPEKIGTTTVAVGTANNVTALQIMGVEDVAGNSIDPYIQTVNLLDTAVTGSASLAAAYSSSIAKPAILVDGKTIKVRFSQPIGIAAASDFAITKATIEDVEVNETPYVTLHLKDSIGTTLPVGFDLKTAVSNKMKTVTGNGVKDGLTINVADLVAPEVQLAPNVTTLTANQTDKDTVTIELPFSENLNGTAANFAFDLIVTRLSDSKELVALTDYTTTVKDNVITIKLDKAVLDNSKYAVSVKKDAKYINDVSANTAVESDTIETDIFVDEFAEAPTVKVDGITATAATVKVTATEVGKVYVVNKLTADPAPTAADILKAVPVDVTTANTEVTSALSSLTAETSYTAYVIFVDSLGNQSEISTYNYTTIK